MHVITRTRLKEFWSQYHDSKSSLQSWYKIANRARWTCFNDVKLQYPSADIFDKLIIFNISGNKYRLIAYIDYQKQKIFIRNVLTHAEYDQNKWKSDPWRGKK